MNQEEKNLIKEFASGNSSLKDDCVSIYRKYLEQGTQNSCIELEFMAEVDTVCPDLALRALYRKKCLNK